MFLYIILGGGKPAGNSNKTGTFARNFLLSGGARADAVQHGDTLTTLRTSTLQASFSVDLYSNCKIQIAKLEFHRCPEGFADLMCQDV